MILIQELKSDGRPRKIPPKEVSEEFYARLMKSKVGKKRYKKVTTPKPEKVKDAK